MNASLKMIGALGVGMGLMYLMDPTAGARRRSRIAGRATAVTKRARRAAGKRGRDLSHRMSGFVHEARRRFDGREQVDDPTLVERVRSQMGHVVSHPHAVHVDAHNGRVTLTGDVLAEEVGTLVEVVGGVRGVHQVDNLLRVHSDTTGVSALQGGRPPGQRRGHAHSLEASGALRETLPAVARAARRVLSPMAALAPGWAGLGLFMLAQRRGGMAALPLGLIGASLMSRGVTPRWSWAGMVLRRARTVF
jgi:hypothetical protein